MEEIYTVIANVGFPIAITMYLLVRIEGRLSELNKTIQNLNNSILTLGNGMEN
ncbi:MAG: YvrJ family protein [Tissierellia bacterium]|nr:YvrJ family protein [Tissierellia bacterium]